MEKISFIYFDIGNVLLLFSNGLEKLAKKYGKTYADFEKVFRKYDDAVCRGQMTPQDLWNKYQEELGLVGGELDFAVYWTKCFILIQETFDLIDDLKNSGIPMGLLSNIYLGVFDILAQKQFLPYIDWYTKILSSEVGTVKPEPEIYQIAEERAGVDPKEILFIDDKEDFLQPAKNRGWKTFQFDPKNPKTSVFKIRELIQGKSP